MAMTKYERDLLTRLFKLFPDIPSGGIWIRCWPHPVGPGCQVFIGSTKYLARVEEVCRAAGFVIGPTKPEGGTLEAPKENELEISRPRVRVPSA